MARAKAAERPVSEPTASEAAAAVRETAKIIKTEAEHLAALAQVEALIEANPLPGTADSDHLELLALLISQYEEEKFPLDPVEAIARQEKADIVSQMLDDAEKSNHSSGSVVRLLSGSAIAKIKGLVGEMAK